MLIPVVLRASYHLNVRNICADRESIQHLARKTWGDNLRSTSFHPSKALVIFRLADLVSTFNSYNRAWRNWERVVLEPITEEEATQLSKN